MQSLRVSIGHRGNVIADHAHAFVLFLGFTPLFAGGLWQ
ncbi:Uncharacterised protein [Vibrio cholerae]|nr:Uncharacterised protein [Vibrio cholerae]